MNMNGGVSNHVTEARDPEGHRIGLLGAGAWNGVKQRLLLALGRSRVGWRLNFSVRCCYEGRTLKVPVIMGRGFQNLQIGEPWLLPALARILSMRRGAFVDVGVNLGQTLIKVKLIDFERPYVGFEPNPQCCQYTSELISINSLPNCMLVPVGLADATGVVTLWAKDDGVDPSASLVPGFRPPARYSRTISVPVFRGDDVCADLDEVAVVKIDTEGGELDVIRGLEKTMRRCAPFIVCEILPVFDERTDSGRLRKHRQDALFATLRDARYSIFRMLQDESAVRMDSIETHSDMALTNYAFVPPAQVDAFRGIFSVSEHSAQA